MSKNELPPFPEEASQVKPGMYTHLNGGRYEVIGVGRDSETLEPIVLYRSLADGSLWSRPLSPEANGGWLSPKDGKPRFAPEEIK